MSKAVYSRMLCVTGQAVGRSAFWSLGLVVPLLLGGCAREGLTAMRARNAQRCQVEVLRETPPPPSPLLLGEAVSYALLHNLDARVARQARELQEERLSAARLRLIPELRANAELSRRSEYAADSSADFETGERGDTYSYSGEKRRKVADVSLVWNLLDFGITYFQMQQAQDRAAIEGQRLKRLRQNLALDVVRAWHRAVVAEAAWEEAATFGQRLAERQTTVRQQLEKGEIPRLDGLAEVRRLVNMRARLQEFSKEWRSARLELASLLGAPPGAELVLPEAGADGAVPPPPSGAVRLQALEAEALAQRPELVERDLQERIAAENVRIAVAQLFPSPGMFLRQDWDDDAFLRFSQWHSAGLKASWNLLALPLRLRQVRVARQEVELAFARQLPVAVGILTQVHLAVVEWEEAAGRWALAQELAGIQSQYLAAIENHVREGKLDPAAQLTAELESFLARVQRERLAADVAIAAARLSNALGRDWAPVSRAAPAAESTPVQSAAEAP